MKGIVFFGGAVILLGVIAYCVSNKRRGSSSSSGYCKLTPTDGKTLGSTAPKSTVAVSPEAERFFMNAVDQYQKKLLSYCILSAAEELGVDAEQQLKLTEKYGLVSLCPMLTSELTGMKETGVRSADIGNAARQWLKNNGYSVGNSEPLEAVEAFLKEKMQKDALDLVRREIAG